MRQQQGMAPNRIELKVLIDNSKIDGREDEMFEWPEELAYDFDFSN